MHYLIKSKNLNNKLTKMLETRKLYQIHSKSFEEKGAENLKTLWEKVKEEGFTGLRMSSALEIQKKEEEDKDNLFHVIFSTSKEDRHGEVVKQDFDLKSFKKNPVILDSHDYQTIEAIIGKAKKLKSDGKLEGDVEFALDNPRGLLAFKLAVGGFLNACSIGFIPKEFSDDFMTIEKSELLEISFVSVPANPESLIEKMQKTLEEAEPAEIMKAAKEEEESKEETKEEEEEEEAAKEEERTKTAAEKALRESALIENEKQNIRKNIYKNIARELGKMSRENQERRKGKIYRMLRNLLRE